MDIKKYVTLNLDCFSPKPKVKSTLLLFIPKKNFFKINDPKNLRKKQDLFLIKEEK